MAVGTYALTSLANLKAWIGETTSTYDSVLESAIDRATAIVEGYCDRKLKSRTFREFVQPNGERTVRLENFPVSSIMTVAYGSAISFSVESDTSSTDVLATVENNGDQLKLRKVASDGTDSTATLAFSSYNTTSALVTQINSSVSGWSATLTKNAYSYSLYRFGGRGVIDAPCNFEYPRDNVSEYRVDFEMGLVHIIADRFPGIRSDDASANRFPSGFQPVFVEYTAGYGTVPDDLEQIAIEIAADIYNDRTNERNVTSESLGDYTYTRAGTAELLASYVDKLAAYREIR
jgi:hypothetical protein